VPFCAARCDYCEFFSVPVGRGAAGARGPAEAPLAAVTGDGTGAGTGRSGPLDPAARERLLDRYIAALLVEWEAARERLGVRRLESVFVGGGTPSLLGEQRLARLFGALEALLTPHAELTVETNLDDVTPAFAAWAAARRLRVSLGVQSFDRSLRAALGRRGDADPAVAFALLRAAGVGRTGDGRAPAGRLARPTRRLATRAAGPAAGAPGAPGVGVDLIFGIPGQDEAAVERELATIGRLEPDHVSYYELSLVPGSVLAARVALTDAGRMGAAAPELPDDDATAAMYRRIVAGLAGLGYRWYEVSNFARPGRRCRHNDAVWRSRNYLGIGPGAVGTVAGVRCRDLPDLDAWLAALEGGGEPPREHEPLSPAVRARERLLLAARTGARVPLAALAGSIDERALPPLVAAGLVSRSGGTLRVTRKGRYVASGVCVRLFRDSSFLEA
jgi:oxygen-independent coproporphyrinogen-3 oxidase